MSATHLLVLYLVLWGGQFNSATDDNESFRKPSSNNDSRIGEIQNQLLKVQTEILVLNTAIVSGDASTSQDVRARLSTLEGEFQSLKQQLADERRKSTTDSGKYDEAIAILTTNYNTMDTQIKALQALLEKKIQDEADKRLPADIVEEIRSHRFASAEVLIFKMGDHRNIASIVHNVYANSPGNIDVLLDFVKASNSIEISFYTLKALRYEMRANGHRDPKKMMSVVEYLRNEVYWQKNVTPAIKAESDALIDGLEVDINTAATEILKAAIYSDNYQKNVQVEALTKALFMFSRNLSDKVMERLVNETFSSVSANKIADNIASNKYIQQTASGLVALFWKLKDSQDLNNDAILKIGNYLKYLRAMGNYASTNHEVIASVNKVIEQMPTCARHLFFTSVICIWNRGKSEYLYAASDAYKWNSDRRNIFTWGSGGSVIQGDWYAEYSDDYAYFKSKAHRDNYLYAAAIAPYDADRRYLFTWAPGGNLGAKSAWKIELDGDYCFLRNKEFKEYMFASGNFHSDLRRYTFTWIPGTSVRQADFQWQIRDCS